MLSESLNNFTGSYVVEKTIKIGGGSNITKEIFIGVAAHKLYKMPKDRSYVPIQVGSYGKKTISHFIRDDIGDNISNMNANFSELTGLYYIWKNIDAEYKGLVHYRRYLSNFTYLGKHKSALSTSELKRLLLKNDVILPKKRRYYIETNYSHYVHAHLTEGLDLTKKIILEKHPEYLSSYNHVMNARSAHMFNMFVMKSALFDEYCEWLFSILFELRDNLDVSNYSKQEARVFGYVSELLLDVWIEKNNISFLEVPVLYVEGQKIVKKGIRFLERKFLGRGETHIGSHIDN